MARARASQDPEESVEGSSPVSSTGSSDAESIAGLAGDPGPTFDPSYQPEDQVSDEHRIAQVQPTQDGLQLEWDPKVIRDLLQAQGSTVHSLVGKTEEDWIYTKTELDAIAGPLTRILNRYDATRAAAATGDELALLLAFVGYLWRSAQETKAASKQAKEAEQGELDPDQLIQHQPPLPDQQHPEGFPIS